MQDGIGRSVVTFQRVLDEGFQTCLGQAKALHEQLDQKFAGRLELLSSLRDELAVVMSPLINELYKTMTSTMFRVLAIMQPEDFVEKGVNFYFLPGYHSCLTDRRIFYREHTQQPASPGSQNFGVGLCGNPLTAPSEVSEYHDCCHARWYDYATKRKQDFFPASPYHWFGYQQPRLSENPYDLIASFTFSTVPQDRDAEKYREHMVWHLEPAGDSRDWGMQVATVLNGMPYKSDNDWIFPDRIDRKGVGYDETREGKLRRCRCLLISLWMHSVFEVEKPQWWAELIEEVEKQQLTGLMTSLTMAEKDSIATNWGDNTLDRPRFNTWTTLSMHPLVAPPPIPVVGPRETFAVNQEASNTYLQTVGWATMLSSAPLGLPFISVVRPWIRMVYGMLRSAEINVLLHSRLPLERAAHSARLLSHEMQKLVNDFIPKLIRDANLNTDDAVDNRRSKLATLQTFAAIAYAVSNAAPFPEKIEERRKEILDSIIGAGRDFETCLYQVAREVQASVISRHGARVEFPEVRERIFPSHHQTVSTCHLLVSEVIRNHCRHGSKNSVAKLLFRQDSDEIEICLEANRDARPSQTFALLHNTLETLLLGSARFEAGDNSSLSKSRYIIKIQIPQGATS